MEYKICSKCGQKKSLSDFHKNGFDNQGNQKYRGYCKDCANKRERDRYREKKDFINSQKTKCEKCGETRVYVLDFHHRDKKEKDFTIGKLNKGSLEILQQEIDKCSVLCANCHREFHYLESSKGITIEEYLSS